MAPPRKNVTETETLQAVLSILRRRSTLQFHPDLEEPCCLFPPRNSRGYGSIRAGGIVRTAHDVAAQIFGKVRPPDLVWDHLCRHKNCWEPTHLEAVPQWVNIARGVHLGARALRDDVCINGHEYTKVNTYIWAGSGSRSCRECHRIRKRKVQSNAK